MIKIGYIQGPQVPSVWDKISPWVQTVVDLSHGRTNMAETLNSLIRGDTLLWLSYDEETLEPLGYWICRIVQYTDVKMLSVDQLGGEDYARWEDIMHDSLILYAKENQCAGMELVGRAGWIRQLKKFGWKNQFSACELMFNEDKVDE